MLSIKPNTPQIQPAFKGYYTPTWTIVSLSNSDTVDNFLKETEDIRKQNFAEEGNFFALIKQRIKALRNVVSERDINDKAKKIRKELDVMA